jgi:ankyrin repeat protein
MSNKINEIETILNSSDALRIIEIPDKIGNTPLMNVVIQNNVELVELFVTKGADINLQNEAGKTALMLACFYRSIPMIKELRTYGASYEKKDRNGLTPLHYGLKYFQFNIYKLNLVLKYY